MKEKKVTPNKTSAQPEVTIAKGRIQMDGTLLVGGSHTTPWWNGKLKTSFLKKQALPSPVLSPDVKDWD